MTKQEHCTALFAIAMYYLLVEGDKLNAEAAINTALSVAFYPWYNPQGE